MFKVQMSLYPSSAIELGLETSQRWGVLCTAYFCDADSLEKFMNTVWHYWAIGTDMETNRQMLTSEWIKKKRRHV